MRAEKPNGLISQDDAERLGLTSYFTGVPCIRGHIDLRRVANGGCKECGRLNAKKHRDNSPELAESRRKICRDWHAKNKDRVSERNQAFRINNRAEFVARRVFYRTNPSTRARDMLASIRCASRKRGLALDVDKQWIVERLERGVCELTGLKFRLEPLPNGRQNPYTASIDRIRPELGYVKGNVRMILWALNAGLNTFGETIYAEIAMVYLQKHPLGTGLT